MRRLIIWHNKEDCIKHYSNGHRTPEFIKELADNHMTYGSFIHFKDEDQIDRFKGLYDVRVL